MRSKEGVPGISIDAATPLKLPTRCSRNNSVVSALTGDWWWLIGGVLVGASVPFTLLVMMPVNNRLLDEKAPPTPDEAVLLLKHWGRLHWIRNILSTLGLAAMLAHGLV